MRYLQPKGLKVAAVAGPLNLKCNPAGAKPNGCRQHPTRGCSIGREGPEAAVIYTYVCVSAFVIHIYIAKIFLLII